MLFKRNGDTRRYCTTDVSAFQLLGSREYRPCESHVACVMRGAKKFNGLIVNVKASDILHSHGPERDRP